MLSVLARARKSIGRAALALAALALAACQPTGGGGPTVSQGEAVPVALLVPGGSGQSSDDVLAQSLQNAARLAAADLGGVKIDLRVYNTKGSPAEAQAMATKAIAEGAVVILGPVYAQEANAVGAVAAASGVNVLSFSNNPAVAGGNVFVLGNTFLNTAQRLAGYAVRNGMPRIMVVSDQNGAGEAGKAAIQTAIAQVGGTVAGSASYEFSQNGIVQAAPTIAASPDLDLAIEELDLSERPRNCLKRAQVNTVGELLTKSEDDLLAITNFGQKSLDEVIEKLDERGLSLRGRD